MRILNRLKNIIIILMTVCMVAVSALGASLRSEAMTPRVMLSEYSIVTSDSSGNIYPGDTFTVNFKLKNTYKNKIMNLKTLSMILAERNVENSALQLDKDAFTYVYRFVMRYILRYNFLRHKGYFKFISLGISKLIISY